MACDEHDYGDDGKCKACGAEKRADMADATREVEILETGTHNGVPFTEADLDEMVANHAALAAYIKPPLKLGHSDAQILHGQKDGDPALGWVAGLRRVGSKLMATVADVPERLADLITKRRYRRVSSEVTLAFDKTGWEKNLHSGVRGKVLTGLALLGADLPAVATLEDLATLLASDTGSPLVIDGPDAQPITFGVSVPRKEGARMTDNTVAELEAALAQARATAQAAQDEAAAKLAAQEAELATLRTEAAKAKERAELAAKERVALEADAYVDSVSRDDNLRLATPESKAHVRALYLKLADGAFSIDADEAKVLKLSDSPKAMTALDVLKGLVASLPDQKALLTQQANPKAGTVDLGVDDELTPIAEKHKLNLSNPVDKAKAITLYAATSPKDRAVARNLGVRAQG